MAVFRVERNTGYTVMSNHHLRNKELTLKAKGLLSQMLSLPEDWDYTLAGLSHINREKIDAIREAVRELERAGYIVRSRERDEKGRLRGADYVIYEQPQLTPTPDLPTLENPTQEKPTLEKPTQENPMQLNKDKQRTDLPNKEKLNTDTQSTHSIPIHSPNPSPFEGAAGANGGAGAAGERKQKEPNDAYRIYEEIIKDNICYDILKQDMPYDHDRIDEIVDLILETVCTRRRTIRIAGDDYPAELVKSKFMKLDSEHIRFVLDCMRENTTKIRNIKQYLRAALFNAPSTIGNYYTSLVAHDMASGALAPRKPQFGDPDYYSCNEGESL
ncbi:MAG TPA: helix-turn-helix domain-containing protein [Candidatus Acetatifactor stercoripullorum]|uniref:Helix-turn-helix domain-containing protein n=1 Tax=Candidatus Acetatifactor stercoripullorum TaxID=2838414 RepID=A0A9D1R404_9FIRM|nr:helix-turn-helix domain-containing protein [Candidatus Acetatifactor stercoripullorum]